KTVSTPSSAGSSAAESQTSPRTNSASGLSHRGLPARCVCGSRLSRIRTFQPSATSRSDRCEPISPAPPVTRAMRLSNPDLGLADEGERGGGAAQIVPPLDLRRQQVEIRIEVDVEFGRQREDR